MGTDDVIHAVRIFRAYTNYTEIDANLKAEVMYRDHLQRNFCLCLYASVMQVLWGRGPDSFYFNFVLACTLMYASAEKKNIFLHTKICKMLQDSSF